MSRKHRSLSSFFAFAFLSATAGVAFACTPQTSLFDLTPKAGPVGTEVRITGQGVAASTPVQVRWNALNGPKLAETVTDNTGSFAVAMKIPSASPGIYFFMVTNGETGVARSAFEVTPGGSAGRKGSTANDAASASSELWSGFSSESGQAPSSAADLRAHPTGNSSLMAGMVLLAAGGTAFFALAALSIRKRRADASR